MPDVVIVSCDDMGWGDIGCFGNPTIRTPHLDRMAAEGQKWTQGGSPTFPDADPENIKLDYLYKWYLWCWSYRELTQRLPTICIPDDHDVYQGNIWGQGGRKSPGRDHDGGYVHPADFVQMVERTQTSHLPDPYWTPALQ